MRLKKQSTGWLSAILLSLMLLVLPGCGDNAATVPTDPPPAKPAGVTAAAGDGEASLSWSAAGDAASYNIYYATTAGVTTANGTKVAGAVSGQALTGLINGTPYYLVVTAVSAAGESVVSDELSITPLPPAPARPSGLVVSGGDGQVTVSWTAVSGAVSYNLYWSATAGVTPVNGTKIDGAVSGMAVTGLNNGTPYYFVVTAVNMGGESVPSTQKSATPSAAPQPPGSPTGVTLTAGAGQVSVAWAAVTVATSYNVYYLESAATPTTAGVIGTGVKLSSAGSPLVVTGLTPGGSYWFSVTAVNAGGESAGQTNPKKAVPL